MRVFSFANSNQAYPFLLIKIVKKGIKVTPRGLSTLEYPDHVTTEILSPRQRVLTTIGRGGNIFWQVAEVLGILSGHKPRAYIEYYNSRLASYSDTPNDNSYHGWYGERIFSWGSYKGKPIHKNTKSINQLELVYQRLRKDPDSRRTNISIWNPELDLAPGHNDYPCNSLMMFLLREGKLNLTQVIRSNDLHLGLFGINVFEFSLIQEILAGWLGADLGKTDFVSNSLHIYTDSQTQKMTDSILSHRKRFDIYKYVKPLDARLPKAKFEKVLKIIMDDEESMRRGLLLPPSDFKLLNSQPYWLSLWKTLRVWTLRKLNQEENALQLALSIEAPDLRVAVLEYMYRNTKNSMLYAAIQKMSLPEPVIDYIFGRLR